MGEVGIAVVVPRDAGAPPTLDELRAFATASRRRLQAPRRPQTRRRAPAHPDGEGRPHALRAVVTDSAAADTVNTPSGFSRGAGRSVRAWSSVEPRAGRAARRRARGARPRVPDERGARRRREGRDRPTVCGRRWSSWAGPRSRSTRTRAGSVSAWSSSRSSSRSSGGCSPPGPFLPTVTQFAPAVREAGSPEQRNRFLGAVASGELTGALAIAEAGGSYDPLRVTATASPDGDGYVLEGSKDAVMGAVGGRRDRRGRAPRRDRGRRRRRRVRRAARRRRRRQRSRHSTSRGILPASTSTACGSRPTASSATRARPPPPRCGGRSRRPPPRSRSRPSARARRSSMSRSTTPSSASSSACRSGRSRRSSTSSPTCSWRSSGPARPATSPRSRSPRTTSAAHWPCRARRRRPGDCAPPARQGGHPDPRRDRLHVGARHAPVRAPGAGRQRVVRHRSGAPRSDRRPDRASDRQRSGSGRPDEQLPPDEVEHAPT